MALKKLPCPSCSHFVERTAKTCPWCSRSLTLSPDGQQLLLDYHECPKCGHRNDKKAIICSECREKLLTSCPACEGLIYVQAEICPTCGVNIADYRRQQEEARQRTQREAQRRHNRARAYVISIPLALLLFFALAVMGGQMGPQSIPGAILLIAAVTVSPLSWYISSKVLMLILNREV